MKKMNRTRKKPAEIHCESPMFEVPLFVKNRDADYVERHGRLDITGFYFETDEIPSVGIGQGSEDPGPGGQGGSLERSHRSIRPLRGDPLRNRADDRPLAGHAHPRPPIGRCCIDLSYEMRCAVARLIAPLLVSTIGDV